MSWCDLTDPLDGPSRTWDPEYDDPAFQALVAELGFTPDPPPAVLEGTVVQVGKDATW